GTVVRLSESISKLIGLAFNQIRLNISNEFGVKQGAMQWFATGTRLAGWGNNDYDKATVIPGLTNVVAAEAYEGQTVVLRSDGTVTAWGRNDAGQTDVPAGLSNVVMVGAGYYHSLALQSDGTVVAWGDNGLGQANIPA